MMLHVLFILDPLPALNAYKDSSVAMMRALEARGHRISVAMQGDLFILDGQVSARSTEIALIPGADLHEKSWWNVVSPPKDTLLKDFGAILMRKDPPFDMEYVYTTHMLEFAHNVSIIDLLFNCGKDSFRHMKLGMGSSIYKVGNKGNSF